MEELLLDYRVVVADSMDRVVVVEFVDKAVENYSIVDCHCQVDIAVTCELLLLHRYLSI